MSLIKDGKGDNATDMTDTSNRDSYRAGSLSARASLRSARGVTQPDGIRLARHRYCPAADRGSGNV